MACSVLGPQGWLWLHGRKRPWRPRQQRLVAGLREARIVVGARVGGEHAGRPPILRMHICVNTTHLLASLDTLGLATLGLHILDVDHMVDLAAVRRAVSNRPLLNGNAAPVRDIRNGTPTGIEAIKRRCYAQAGERYIVGVGCEVPSGTPDENLKALCRSVSTVHVGPHGILKTLSTGFRREERRSCAGPMRPGVWQNAGFCLPGGT